MKRKILFFAMLFLGVVGYVKAYDLDCGESPLYTYPNAGTTYTGAAGVCEYYNAHPEVASDKVFTVEVDDKCYVTHYYDSVQENPLYHFTGHMENGTCVGDVAFDEGQQQNQNVTNGSGSVINKGFLVQDNLNIAKIVYEINKGGFVQQFKTKYNLDFLKAATIGSGNGETLALQFKSNNANDLTTLKIGYTRNSANKITSLTATLDSSDQTSLLLKEFPFWILSAAPDYDASTYQNFKNDEIKEKVFAAFSEVTGYKITQNGNSIVLSTSIPDDVNEQVMAVYSDFLSSSDIADYLQEQSDASTEGQPTKDKVKNTKTGAFLDIKIVSIGFIIAFIGGFLVFRYSKMKKI